MLRPVSFTLDVEDLRTSAEQPYRVRLALDLVLEWMSRQKIVATVFVVGDLAAENPDLVADIVAAGHEIGLHGWRHVPLTRLDPTTFARHLTDGRKLLEDQSGQTIEGFRAPTLSLTPASGWAVECIGAAGFSYSSSILPAPNPLYGFPGLPLSPFRWANGVIELPCPTVSVLGRRIPYLGGAYLRVLPNAVWRRGMRLAGPTERLWTYCHPWEFDTTERFHRHPDVGWVTSVVGFVGRRRVPGRLGRVLAGGVGPTLGDLVADTEWVATLPEHPLPGALAPVS